MALGNFNNYLCFNLLSSLMGNSGQPIVVRLWVQGADNHQIVGTFFLVAYMYLLEDYDKPIKLRRGSAIGAASVLDVVERRASFFL